MTGNLHLIICENFAAEVSAVITASTMDNVTVRVLPAHCDAPRTREELLTALTASNFAADDHGMILGGSCLAGCPFAQPLHPQVQTQAERQCLEMVLPKQLLAHYQQTGAYVTTPGWLARWQRQVEVWGFDRQTVREFFAESAGRVVLLDTGVDDCAGEHLMAFSAYIGLPAETLPIGLDYFQHYLSGIVLNWRLDAQALKAASVAVNDQQESADNALIFDVLRTLATMRTERHAVAEIYNLFAALFAPGSGVYLPIVNGQPGTLEVWPIVPTADPSTITRMAETQRRLADLQGNYAWTESGQGFRIRIGPQDAPLGIFELDHLAFPEHRARYLNLALTIANVAALSITNARTFEKLQATQDRLASSELRYRTIFETVSVAILEEDYSVLKKAVDDLVVQGVTDFEWYLDEHPEFVRAAADTVRLVDLNQAALEMYGAFDKVDLSDKLGQAFSLETPDIFRDEIIAIARGQTFFQAETINRTLQGEHLDVLLTIAFPAEAARFNRVLISKMNTTQLKQAEAALREYSEQLEEMVASRTRDLEIAQERLLHHEKLAVLGQLAGSVSHELRNPLGIISNATYILQMLLADADPAVNEYLDIIRTEVHTSDAIIHDLLDFGRTRQAEPVPTPVGDLIDGVLQQHPAPPGISVLVEIPPDLPDANVDGRQITLVLNNLVTNAYQAMDAGGSLSICAHAEPGGVAVAIADTGSGISAEHFDRLFEPLFTTKQHGVGLGLALSKDLAAANGGTITVISTEGEGSVFTLRLPTPND